MSLDKTVQSRITKANQPMMMAAQHGLYGHIYWASADGDSGTAKRFATIQAIKETVITYRDVTRDIWHNSITIPAGDEIVGLMDQVTVTGDGQLRCYFAGF